MTVDESRIVEDSNEILASACLLAEGIVGFICVPLGNGYCSAIYLEAGDVFAWGMDDLEIIRYNDGDLPSDLIDVYVAHRADPEFGRVSWLCFKRNMQPQRALKVMMQKADKWTAELDALPLNPDSR